MNDLRDLAALETGERRAQRFVLGRGMPPRVLEAPDVERAVDVKRHLLAIDTGRRRDGAVEQHAALQRRCRPHRHDLAADHTGTPAVRSAAAPNRAAERIASSVAVSPATERPASLARTRSLKPRTNALI